VIAVYEGIFENILEWINLRYFKENIDHVFPFPMVIFLAMLVWLCMLH